MEDDQLYAELFSAYLKESFSTAQLLVFNHPDDALSSDILASRVKYVFFDLYYYGENQTSFIQSILDKYFNAELIVLSSSENVNDLIRCMELGASGYMIKSPHEEEVLESLRVIKGEGAYISATMAKKLMMKFSLRKKTSENIDGLSIKEERTLNLLSLGKTYEDTAKLLNISTEGLRSRIRKIYKKLRVKNRTEAIEAYYNRKLK